MAIKKDSKNITVKLFQCDHSDDTSHKYFPRFIVQDLIKYINAQNNNVPIVLFNARDSQHSVSPYVDPIQICGFTSSAFLDEELYLNIRIRCTDTYQGQSYTTLLESCLVDLEHTMCFTYTNDTRYVNVVDGVQLHYFVCKPKNSNISYAFTT